MLSDKMEKQLNEHTNAEFYSAYLYLSMAAYFDSVDLAGFANWMKVQFQEEMFHGMRFFEYIGHRDGRARLDAIQTPPVEWDSPIAVFEETYKHEQAVSARIHALVSLAMQENDFPTNNFLQWFVAEQTEEESTVKAILKKLRFVGDSKSALLMIDQELAGRVFTPPASTAAIT